LPAAFSEFHDLSIIVDSENNDFSGSDWANTNPGNQTSIQDVAFGRTYAKLMILKLGRQ